MLLAWILLAVGVILIALTAVYVAAEFSLVTVDRAAIDRAIEDGDTGLVGVRRSLTHLSTQLSGAQVGITVTTLALGYVMEPSLATLLTGPLGALGLGAEAAGGVAVTLALAVATVASMVLGELVPKNIAIARPLSTARAVNRINRVTTTVCAPLIRVLNGTANATLRLVGVEPTEELASARSAEELESLVRRSGAHGLIETASARLVAQSLRFSAKSADDVLTPRVDLVTVAADDSAADVIGAAVTSGLSRFPVTAGDLDTIVGVVHVKRAVAVPPADRPRTPVRSLAVPFPRVPGTLPLDDLLVVLREPGLQMVLVLDEYGGTAGIVTLEDVVEELIGEIDDEHDDAETPVTRLADGALEAAASLRPDEIAARAGLTLPDPEEYDTLAGLVTERLGRLAAVGDRVVVTAELAASASLGAEDGAAPAPVAADTDFARGIDVALLVTSVVGRRIATVQIRVASPPNLAAGPEDVP